MREQIDTIPVNEAFEAMDECPFCALERKVEQKAIRYTAGPRPIVRPAASGKTSSLVPVM